MAPETGNDKSTQRNLRDQWDDLQLTRSQIDPLIEQGKQNGDLKPAEQALKELQLKSAVYDKLLQEQVTQIRGILGRNFLGVEEWKKGFDVSVGRPPPIPDWITRELLEGECQLHPGEKVKDTHILVLIPSAVNREAYSAVKLAELCEGRKGSGDGLIDANYIEWKSEPWANESQTESEWVLIPKSDPNRYKVPADKHFRNKTISEQSEVHKHYAEDYREARAVEVMTVAILNYVVHEEHILDDYILLTQEPNDSGGRVWVGDFDADGLLVYVGSADNDYSDVGRALARKASQVNWPVHLMKPATTSAENSDS